MTTQIKVIRVRTICSICKCFVGTVCLKCKKDPTRKPTVIEIYNLPPIIKNAECGCCVQFQCMREGCPNTLWRPIVQACHAKRQFCTRDCQYAVLKKEQYKRVLVDCANPTCNKKCARTPYDLKTFKRAYCCGSCKMIGLSLFRKKKTPTSIKEENLDLQDLQCQKCRRPEVHTKNGSTYTCQVCKTKRNVNSAYAAMDLVALKKQLA